MPFLKLRSNALALSFQPGAVSRAEDIREPLPEIDGQRRNSVDATTAASLIPLALGLAGRQGKSLLFEYRARKLSGFDKTTYDELRESGMSAREATEALLDHTGLADERSLRRRFAKSDVHIGQGKTSPPSRARAKSRAKSGPG